MSGTLGPGSAAPRSPAEVEQLLRLVPQIVFFPELGALLPAPLAEAPLGPEAVTAGADEEFCARVLKALEALEARAAAHDDGGLRFLAVTLRHFLTAQKLPPAEHPLVVALFARTAARRGDFDDHPVAVARAMNRWD